MIYMYKLVNAPYENIEDFIVEDEKIIEGYYFCNDDILLTNADESVFKDFILQRDYSEYDSFESYLDYLGIDYMILPTMKYEDEETVSQWTYQYEFCYSYAFDYFSYSHDFTFGEEVTYYEFYDGRNFIQMTIECIDDLEKIESNINWSKNNPYTGIYNLYKSLDCSILYLEHITNFVDDLRTVEEITTEDLRERFNYEIYDCV